VTAALTRSGVASDWTRQGLRRAQEVTARGSRSFYFASWALDPRRRAAAYALYAFLRGADDAVDAGDPASARRRWAQVEARRGRAFAGAPGDPLEAALAWAVEAFGIPRAPLEELVQALATDLGPVRVATWTELDRYCHGVASTVGLALAPILGAPPEAAGAAAALGRAMQLTNILRDVRADLEQLDRIYLPAEALDQHGVREADLRAPSAGPPLRRLAAEIAERARVAYAQSEAGVRAIGPPRSRLTVRLMRAVYAEILSGLERRDFDVLGPRVVVSTGRKLALAGQVLLGLDPGRPRGRAEPAGPPRLEPGPGQ
jgi:phytoene synthase